MTQRSLPCLLMRAGTSKGPYFRRQDLPNDPAIRDQVLVAAMGSPDPRQIDGVGGADSLTSKAAIIGRSTRLGVDIDYLFAQVSIDTGTVDTAPSCGNMLAGVGPAAIEFGLVPATDGETRMTVFNENTGSRIEVVVQTPGGIVQYDGTATIDGVPGSAAPVRLNMTDIVGSKTGALLPTGQPKDIIDGIEVSCVDVAMPMVLIRAADIGLRGDETAPELESQSDVLARIEKIRLTAGQRMGLGDVSNSVVPKVGLLSEARNGGHLTSRYLTPWRLHATHAVTGAMCVASAAKAQGTVAADIAKPDGSERCTIEHPAGAIDIHLRMTGDGPETDVEAGTQRTARLLMRGEIMIPAHAFVPQDVCDNSLMSAA